MKPSPWDDLRLALWLLRGVPPGNPESWDDGPPGRRVLGGYVPTYPEDGSADDRRAREAIFRLLSDRDCGDARDVLIGEIAMMFHPDEEYFGRRLVPMYRKDGRPELSPRRAAIYKEVEALYQSKMVPSYNKAYEKVAKARKLSAGRVKEIHLEEREMRKPKNP